MTTLVNYGRIATIIVYGGISNELFKMWKRDENRYRASWH